MLIENTVVETGAERFETPGRAHRLDALSAATTAIGRSDIIGESPALREVLRLVGLVAPSAATVLITGETGTGKELVVRAIHERSPRQNRPFVAVNCGAIPVTLIASEMFGHERGAFTGASQRRIGRFEQAGSGTIFLDEITELPMETQTALLRVLQEREFERVGGERPIRTDVRIVAATNRNLEVEVADGRFRADLFYRINVVPIVMPPLRDRKEDIPRLVDYFVDRSARSNGKAVRRLAERSLDLLMAHSWPGNVRELWNIIERAVVLAQSGAATVDARWLEHREAGRNAARRETECGVDANPAPASTFAARLSAGEKQMIETALRETLGRVSGRYGAAAKLRLPPSTLESKIRALRIDKSRFMHPRAGEG